ncbi:hypothetical protein GBAR_LOCUS27005 [Geodia barretti]|uniref:Death domain-containing protein n=2 Tax=Geodia barretti TaxID=519541 RepID=A0AA35XE46_GEOBA|nr:hypothetical protein GBAR_LOCUS27005 [Geodia barretti]
MEVTDEDVIAKKVVEDIQPTFEVIAEKTVIVTNEEQHVIWEGYGLRLYIPPDSLPEGCSHLELSVNVGLSGEFQLPENAVIVSAVYSFSHHPIESLRQPVTLEMEHCAAASALDNLSVVRANTNSNSFSYVPGGDFTSVKGYAVIKLHSFSRFATFLKKHFRSLLPHSSNEIEYSANIYYTKMLYCHFNFEFFIIQNLSALAKRVEDQISKRVKGNYERGPISNFKFQEDEVSVEIQESCGNGWNMKELTPLEVFKRDVDRFSARKELCTCQVKVWCENEEAPKHLLQRVLIKGAKKQCDFLTVTSPTTCLTKPALPSNTPFSPRSVDTTVFFYVKPKLADLSNELGDLTWSEIKSLAVQLDIDYNELLKIQEQTDQATDRMHQALNIWLKKDPNASWEKVIYALDRVKGKDVLIQTLKEKYLPQSPGLQAGGQ